MKKVLALVLCVLMLSSCFVFTTSAEVAADYDWRKVIYDAGYGTIVPNMTATAPVIDGVVNEGEYTKSDVFTAEDSALLQVDFNAKTVESLKMSYAHDIKYVYVAVQLTTTGAQWTSQNINLQLGARNKAQGLSKDVWGNRLDMTNKFNADGTPVLIYNEEGAPYTRYNDTSYQAHKDSLFYYGPNFEYGEDVEVKMAFSNGNKTRTQEYKLSKDYLKAINSANQYKFENNVLVDTSAGDAEADNAFVAIQWLVNSNYGFFLPKTNSEMTGAATAAGDESASWFAWPVYFCDYDYRKVQANDGSAIFAGAAVAPENAPVVDGVVNEGEYTTKNVYTNGSAPAWIDLGAKLWSADGADLKQISLYTAHDGKNLYMAIETERNNSPIRKDLADRIWMQWCAYDKPVNLLATNFVNRSQAELQYNADGTAKNIPANNAIVASVFKPSYDDGGVTAVYEYKFDLDILSEKYTKVTTNCKDGIAEMTEADYSYRDTFFIKMHWNYANTAFLNGWTNCNSANFLQTSPKNNPNTVSILNYIGDKSEKAYGGESYSITWGYTPIFLFANEAPATNETASVRISSTNSGLRFKTRIAEWDIQELVNKYGYADVQVGTLIAPTDTLDGALTHESGTAGVDYLDVKADLANPYAKSNCVYTFAGSITNIKKDNLDRDFTAVGYIAYTDAAGQTHYIYSASASTRNVSAVATAALADETANYTDVQKIILGNLVVAK